ncbi:MAG: F0F1 ATP synthase subunit A [Ruminococcus sp.]|nr:F0F1 ATP synthase subunit A [Ruminococcus sp.]
MKKADKKFQLADRLLIFMTILPIIIGIVIKVLTTPAEEGIAVHGALIYFTLPAPVQNLPITESQVNSWLVMTAIAFLCLYLTHGIRRGVETKRQYFCEWIVEMCYGMVKGNMGEFFKEFAPFIASILALSAFSSLICLFGLYSPTSDINVVAGWAILVFGLITYYKMKCGPKQYLKSFGEPVKFLAPLNIISEVATPISMSFRHYGNVLSGSVISVLVASGLQGVSAKLFSGINFPFLQIGIPAVLSIYFDVFSGCLQAYIFAMLTMLYVSGGFPAEEYFRRKAEKSKKVN